MRKLGIIFVLAAFLLVSLPGFCELKCEKSASKNWARGTAWLARSADKSIRRVWCFQTPGDRRFKSGRAHQYFLFI